MIHPHAPATILSLGAGLFAVVGLAVVVTQEPAPAELAERVTALAEEALEESGGAGIAIAVDFASEPFLAEGWGFQSDRRRERIDADTPLPATAMNGPFVSAAIVRLAQDGELDLDDAVAKHVPAFEDSEHGLTVHHLLSSTSGLPRLEAAVGDDVESRGRDAVLAKLAGGPLEGAPGYCFAHTEADTLVLGSILESVTEAAYADALRELVFEPLGMDATRFCSGDSEAGTACREIAGELVEDLDAGALLGAGCLCTSARDLTLFQRGLAGRELVDEGSWRTMTAGVQLDDGTDTGRGYVFDLTPLGEHEGLSFGGMSAASRQHVAYYPSYDMTIAVVAAGDDVPVAALERRIARAVFDMPNGDVANLPLDAEDLGRYVGVYQVGCMNMEVAAGEGGLVFRPIEGPPTQLLYQGSHHFVSADDPELHLTFDVEGDTAKAVLINDRGRVLLAIRVA